METNKTAVTAQFLPMNMVNTCGTLYTLGNIVHAWETWYALGLLIGICQRSSRSRDVAKPAVRLSVSRF